MEGRKPSIWVSLAILIFAAPMVSAHEITTRDLITDHAYRNSLLNPTNANSIFSSLGFHRLDAITTQRRSRSAASMTK